MSSPFSALTLAFLMRRLTEIQMAAPIMRIMAMRVRVMVRWALFILA